MFELKMSVDTGNEKQVKALIAYLETFIEEPKEETKAQKSAPKKPKTEKADKPAKQKEKAQETATEAREAKTEGARGIQVEDVRAKLSAVVSNHRDAIKSKLTELGAKNLTSLNESKYEEFMDFLNSLE